MTNETQETTFVLDMNNLAASLEQLNEAQLSDLLSVARSVLKHKEEEKKREAMEAIRRLAAEHGLAVEVKAEGSAGRQRRKRPARPPKYRNPANPSQTWSGIGARPKWFREALQSGMAPEDMLIEAA